MLTCKQVHELVTEYLEDKMSLWQRMRFGMHIMLCPHCRVHLKNMQKTVDALGRLPPEAEIPEEIIEHFRNYQR